MLTKEQIKIHNHALVLSRTHRRLEAKIIEALQSVNKTKLYKQLDKPSLFLYAVDILGFTEPVAYSFISVAKKCLEIPELQRAIKNRELSVSKASRIVSALTKENADDLVEFAKTHTYREIDWEVAKRHPQAARKNKIKIVSENQAELTVTVSKITIEGLKRVESLLAQRNKPADLGEAVSVCTEYYLNAHDPVRKAERNVGKPARPTPAAPTRRPTAQQKHVVLVRDQGRCTHLDLDGKRCNSDRWVDVHHIIQVSQGGSNEPENLTTLCSFHHDLVHQMTMPLDGEFSWLR